MEQGKTVKEIGKALGVSFLTTIVFLLLMALAMLKLGLNETIVSKLMLVGYLLAPAVGGFLLGKKQKVNRFLWGLLVGTLYFAAYFLLAVCTMDVSASEVLWVALPICLGGMAGGMIS